MAGKCTPIVAMIRIATETHEMSVKMHRGQVWTFQQDIEDESMLDVILRDTVRIKIRVDEFYKAFHVIDHE